jgi:hypothetical protein
VLPTTIESLNVDLVLRALHEYFSANPRDQIEDGGRSNSVMRTVRTTLNEIVKHLGDGVRRHLRNIPNDSDIHFYVGNMLAHRETRGGPDELDGGDLGATAPAPQRTPSPRAAAGPLGVAGAASVQRSAAAAVEEDDDDAEGQLERIFGMLHKKETTQEALKLLYRFRQQRPHYDLGPHLASTSEVFQAYIMRGLKRVEEAERAQQQSAAGGGDGSGALAPSASFGDRAALYGGGGGDDGSMAPASRVQSYRSRMEELKSKAGGTLGRPLPKEENPALAQARRASLGAAAGAEAAAAEPASDSSALDRIRSRLAASRSSTLNSESLNAPPSDAPPSASASAAGGSEDALARLRSRIQRIRQSDADQA